MQSTETAASLMDAAERLLIEGGHGRITTRRVAEAANQSHGLIRYHFGSLEGLMLATVRRSADRILERQHALYSGDAPFIEKWRTAMAYLESDLTEDGFPKLALELLAMGWNDPSFTEDLRKTMDEFTGMLIRAVETALEDYRLDLTDEQVTAVATLIRTFQLGIMVERLAGIDTGHRALLSYIDDWMQHLHETKREGRDASA
jgi:AcrR family transcriptional regulator